MRSWWWSAAAAVAVISAARWLRAPALPYLGVSVGATVVAVFLALRQRGSGAIAARTASFALAAFAVVASADQYMIWQLETDWPAVSASITTNAQTTARATLNNLANTLHSTAVRALDAPSDSAGAFRAVAASLGQERYATERGVVLYRASAPVAWAGAIRAQPSDDSAAYAVTWSDFYVTLQATATRGGSRAVATALLHADPPADRLARALDEWIVQRTGVVGFAFNHPIAPFSGDLFAPGGPVLLSIEPLPPRVETIRPRVIDRSRHHGVALLALALIAFIGAEWHPRAPLGRRLAALTVPILSIVIVPLNTLSNLSPIFDPTYFYSQIGGPLTASVGALALTSAIAALGALAIVQAGLRVRPRFVAAILAVLICVVAPYLLHGMAEGITSPGSGVPLEVWIIWQVTLALTGTAILSLAVVAGRSAIISPAGIRPGITVGLTVVAATIGAMIWRPTVPWPAAYSALWIAAGICAAFASGSRARVMLASVVAGCGAALLIWSANAERRIALAERDVAGLTTPDPNATLLLERFGADLAVESPPRSRADLLKLYATSDLASGGYPVALTEWSPDGDTIATLQLAQFTTSAQQVARAVSEARAGDSTVIMESAGSPGVQLVLAAPGPTHAVTTVVVAPTTRLISPSADAPLLGIAPDASTAPPMYTLTPIRVVAGADTLRSRRLMRRWTRTGEQLHADWLVGGALGSARAHVEIDLRSIDALAERGTLLLLLDLIVIGMLWMLAAITGGAFWRWLRWRARRWAHSYRAQLTVVLFAFFVTPALLFAAWSYRRLASDDRQSHALRVLETLRSVVNNGEVEFLQVAGNRLDTPLLLYRGGELAGTSDTLLAELAPIGAYLRPDIQLGLGLAEEVTADRVERLDATTALIGYRAATDDRGEHVVLAAPSGADAVEDAALTRRRDDLSILLMFATVAGAVAALWLSGLAAREFARPIDALRRAALAAAAGVREPDLGGEPPAEFIPVFSAFRRMAADFGASQRVLAWGQMARQVAHEIKNPLTPIRLGVQHLQRAHADKRKDFDRILQQNATRILAEIDRLDEIARAFSRYGTAPEERPPAEPTDVAAVVRDVVELERMGADSGIQWSVTTDGPLSGLARADDLREVVLNLLENARLAHARHVRVHVARDSARVAIAVHDDGDGIPEDVMPRIFEPHFSTRTSGSGLGLAMSRRLVDGWGGSIAVRSEKGQGTTVTVFLAAS
ncbi:MAG TPA: HAMP domain-containing sensor histidine kinase [Gemmatimonadaceae bacterium]|nr:HAMP domain-containing sensor histidine kinase [Gemmatimonadaceae bacterium]